MARACRNFQICSILMESNGAHRYISCSCWPIGGMFHSVRGHLIQSGIGILWPGYGCLQRLSLHRHFFSAVRGVVRNPLVRNRHPIAQPVRFLLIKANPFIGKCGEWLCLDKRENVPVSGKAATGYSKNKDDVCGNERPAKARGHYRLS
jgi:hypothetical protein